MDVVAICGHRCADRSGAPFYGEVGRGIGIDVSGRGCQLCTLDLQVVTVLVDRAGLGEVALREPFSREIQRASIGVTASRVTTLPVTAVGLIDLDAAGIERSHHILPARSNNLAFPVNSSG